MKPIVLCPLLVMLLVVVGDIAGTYNPIVKASDTSVVRVQYLDGSPRSGADVFRVDNGEMLGRTNVAGEVDCSFLGPGGYEIYALYPPGGPQFGLNVFLRVPGNSTITADYEITPPNVTFLSPQNQTYANFSIPLTYTIYDYSPLSWTGYSLDGQANVTITGNTTLAGLTIGSHIIVVYSNDTYGNMGSSSAVHFERASGTVTVRVRYLDDRPRSNADVYVFDPFTKGFGLTNERGEATLNDYLEPGDYLVRADYPINGPQFGGNRPLHVDENGDGNTTITANYEITPPAITILSPQNSTYTGGSIPLTFNIYDYSSISWMGYSLDGQSNVTATGNTTLTVGEGTHRVVVFANDTFGNMGASQTVHFTYSTKVQVTFAQTGVGIDFTGAVVVIDGTNYKRTDLPASFDWDMGSSHSFAYQSPLTVAANAKRYVWYSTGGPVPLQNGNINATSAQTVTGNYKTQYYLAVSSSYDSPSPPSNWFDENTNITASVTSVVSGPTGTRYMCTGWTGTGNVPSTGTGSSTAFAITQPSSITWNWKTQHLLTVSTSPNGLVPQPSRIPVGEVASANSWWYDSLASTTLTAEAVENCTLNFWSVDDISQGSETNPVSVNMDTSHIAVAHYNATSPYTDIAVLNVASFKIIVGIGYTMTINITVENQGTNTETFNLTTYAETYAVAFQTVTLESGVSIVTSVVWNTTGFAYGNYTLSAYAWPVPEEIDVANNNYTCTYSVHVGVAGDVSGPTQGVYDGTTNMRDINYLILLFNSNPSSPNWKPNADINNDATVNMRDIQIAILNFNKHE